MRKHCLGTFSNENILLSQTARDHFWICSCFDKQNRYLLLLAADFHTDFILDETQMKKLTQVHPTKSNFGNYKILCVVVFAARLPLSATVQITAHTHRRDKDRL